MLKGLSSIFCVLLKLFLVGRRHTIELNNPSLLGATTSRFCRVIRKNPFSDAMNASQTISPMTHSSDNRTPLPHPTHYGVNHKAQ